MLLDQHSLEQTSLRDQIDNLQVYAAQKEQEIQELERVIKLREKESEMAKRQMQIIIDDF